MFFQAENVPINGSGSSSQTEWELTVLPKPLRLMYGKNSLVKDEGREGIIN